MSMFTFEIWSAAPVRLFPVVLCDDQKKGSRKSPNVCPRPSIIPELKKRSCVWLSHVTDLHYRYTCVLQLDTAQADGGLDISNRRADDLRRLCSVNAKMPTGPVGSPKDSLHMEGASPLLGIKRGRHKCSSYLLPTFCLSLCAQRCRQTRGVRRDGRRRIIN